MDSKKYLNWKKKWKAHKDPHGSEDMAGDRVCGYVRDSAADMVTKHTIKDVKTKWIAL